MFFSEDDKRYIADILQLNFGGAFGDTPEQALDALALVYSYYCEDMSSLNQELPKPIHLQLAK